jgi:DNA ligase (NAD+)
MIIPQVADNLTRSGTYELPRHCPCCGTELTVRITSGGVKELYCPNENCIARNARKIARFCDKNAMNIEGLSEATLEKFIELGWVNSFKDIFTLNNHFTELVKLSGFGKKSADKLMKAIEKSKNTTLDRFIYALSIPLIGKSASKTISKHFNGDFNIFYKTITEDPFFDWTEFEDFGFAMDISLQDYFNEWHESVNELANEMTFNIPQAVNVSNVDLSGKTFVITGSLNHFENRDVAKEKIESLGGKVTGSVTKKDRLFDYK